MSVDFCGCPLCCTAVTVTTSGHVTVGPRPEIAFRPTTIFDLVKADLDERDRKGAKEHGGRPLMAGDGRDFLREAYEEALDLAVYLHGALAERQLKK